MLTKFRELFFAPKRGVLDYSQARQTKAPANGGGRYRADLAGIGHGGARAGRCTGHLNNAPVNREFRTEAK